MKNLLEAKELINKLDNYEYPKIYNNVKIEGSVFKPYFEGGNIFERI